MASKVDETPRPRTHETKQTDTAPLMTDFLDLIEKDEDNTEPIDLSSDDVTDADIILEEFAFFAKLLAELRPKIWKLALAGPRFITIQRSGVSAFISG